MKHIETDDLPKWKKRQIRDLKERGLLPQEIARWVRLPLALVKEILESDHD